MKKPKEKESALKMRARGMSYSQIKSKIKVSKSTLSTWLENHPLSPEDIVRLRDLNPIRIEKYRNTRLKNREEKLKNIYNQISKEIGILSERELFLAGLFLYWGEGTKAARDMVAFTNTDPDMVKFFIRWINLFGIEKNSLKVKLHLYSDMDVEEKVEFWSNQLSIPKQNFRKPYIKESKFSSLTYKNSFGQGTCTVIYGSSEIHNRIIMGLKYLREVVSGK